MSEIHPHDKTTSTHAPVDAPETPSAATLDNIRFDESYAWLAAIEDDTQFCEELLAWVQAHHCARACISSLNCSSGMSECSMPVRGSRHFIGVLHPAP